MLLLAAIGSLAAIALLCWLLFTLAVFALPVFIGTTAGAWAHGTGAGLLGAAVVGLAAAAATLAASQLALAFTRSSALKLIVAAAFVAPAAFAGFHATHGIVKHLTPGDVWQTIFSIVGGLAVGVTALARIAGMAIGPDRSGPPLARA